MTGRRSFSVSVFLRGGADGLHLFVPHGDDTYYRARPGIGLKKSELADLDGFFGLNPDATRSAAFGPHSNDGTLTFGSVSAV